MNSYDKKLLYKLMEEVAFLKAHQDRDIEEFNKYDRALKEQREWLECQLQPLLYLLQLPGGWKTLCVLVFSISLLSTITVQSVGVHKMIDFVRDQIEQKL
jgi:hypothetical protein